MTGIASAPSPLPMAIIGVTPANETPLTKGSLAPIRQNPRVWRRVARPAVKSEAPIRKAVSVAERPTAGPTIMGGATTPAYMAATCWRPLVNIFSGGRVSSTGCLSRTTATASLRNLGVSATASSGRLDTSAGTWMSGRWCESGARRACVQLWREWKGWGDGDTEGRESGETIRPSRSPPHGGVALAQWMMVLLYEVARVTAPGGAFGNPPAHPGNGCRGPRSGPRPAGRGPSPSTGRREIRPAR
ncbi:hypothetical protein EES37_27290 [Streptomyces sp. ADI91-18]|nr:hypothetical protein EES37_27290 [Streptomyces sp. ADI91-18]